MKRKDVSMSARRGAAQLLHVETPLGIVNVRIGLTDVTGQRVERVEYIPNQYAGEPLVKLDGNVRALRAVEQTSPASVTSLEERLEEAREAAARAVEYAATLESDLALARVAADASRGREAESAGAQ